MNLRELKTELRELMNIYSTAELTHKDYMRYQRFYKGKVEDRPPLTYFDETGRLDAVTKSIKSTFLSRKAYGVYGVISICVILMVVWPFA